MNHSPEKVSRALRQLMGDAAGEPWHIRPGETIRRKELHARYGGPWQGGIAPSGSTPNILIFSDLAVGEHHGYSYDGWDSAVPGLFHYTGEGQQGHQAIVRGNKAILNHVEDGRALRVFEGVGGEVRYLGEFQLNDPPYDMAPAHVSGGSTIRDVVVFHLRSKDMAPTHPLPPPPGTKRTYRRAKWTATKAPAPWSRDPNILDRSLKAHIDTQNALSDFLAGKGLEVWSPQVGEPDHDLAWQRRGTVFVAEVKSLPAAGTEDRQIRLGIGQVLDYQALMARHYDPVRAVLALEKAPRDPRWIVLCASHGIRLVWPGTFDALMRGRR